MFSGILISLGWLAVRDFEEGRYETGSGGGCGELLRARSGLEELLEMDGLSGNWPAMETLEEMLTDFLWQ